MSSEMESNIIDRFSLYRELFQLSSSDSQKFMRLFLMVSFQHLALLYLVCLIFFDYTKVGAILAEVFGECFIYLYLIQHLHEERTKRILEMEEQEQ